MRRIRLSRTFAEELARLCEQGVERFGFATIERSKERVRAAIETRLVHNPVRQPHPVVGLCTYHVDRTPFTLFYDHDDDELRIHIVVHARSDWSRVDLSQIEW